MSLINWIKNTSQYIWKAATRVFSPSDDDYPQSGVQPFSGEDNQDQQKYS
jgi:hypothetical protein